MEFAYEHWDLLGFTETGYAFLVIKDGTTNPSFQVFIFLWMAGLVRNHIPGRRRGYPAMNQSMSSPGTSYFMDRWQIPEMKKISILYDHAMKVRAF